MTPLRVPIPTDENCKFSDDLDDSVCTICKICDAEVTLTGMRRHTKLKHKLKITKYKELHGPFKIIEHVYHKCHLCDKILILDNSPDQKKQNKDKGRGKVIELSNQFEALAGSMEMADLVALIGKTGQAGGE